MKLEHYIIIILLAFVIVFSVVVFASGAYMYGDSYIRGKYGTKCYIEGQEHKNIEYKLKIDTYEECIKY